MNRDTTPMTPDRLPSRGQTVWLAALVIVLVWSTMAWVGWRAWENARMTLGRLAVQSAETVAARLELKLDLVRTLAETVDITSQQIPDPYTVRLIAAPSAQLASDELDAVMLVQERREIPLLQKQGADALPPCAMPASDRPALYAVSGHSLLVAHPFRASWGAIDGLCGKLGVQALNPLFAGGYTVGLTQLRLRVMEGAGILDAADFDVGTAYAGEALARRPLLRHPVEVLVSAPADAMWRLWWEETRTLWLAVAVLTLVSVVFAFRALHYLSALEFAATRDALTQLYNRRAFQQLAALEVQRAVRHGDTLAALVVDADHFKQINDMYGHDAGDRVLRQLATVLQASGRGTDLIARFGGEEFVVLAAVESQAAALALAERLRSAVELQPTQAGAHWIPLTVSIGLACAAPTGWAETALAQDALTESGPSTLQSQADLPMSIDRLLRLADRALYLAKARGRNRVEYISDGT